MLLVKLKLVFEEKFRYDDEGVPRLWKPDDDIDAVFKKAKDAVSALPVFLLSFESPHLTRLSNLSQVLSLIPLYSTISPLDSANIVVLPSSLDPSDLENPEFDFPSTLIILTETKADELSARFRREADAYYLEAKRSIVSSISQIPYWIYGVLTVLGWNEFVAVLKNPLYFTFLLLIGAGVYITIQLNMVCFTFLFLTPMPN